MRYVVVAGEHSYPIGAELARVRKAGGLRFLPNGVRMKVVRVGEDCSDMPRESLPGLLASGHVARVEGED